MRTPAIATPGLEVAPQTRGTPWPMLGAWVVVGALTAAVATPLVVSTAMGAVLEGRVMPHVSVAGVPVGLLTAAEAESRLRAELADLSARELVVTVDGAPTSVPLTSLGRDHDLAALVNAAMAVGRSGDPWADGQARIANLVVGTDIADAVRVDGAALDQLVVATAARAFTRPRDAAVVTNPDGTYAVVPPHAGRRLHPDVVRPALEAVLLAPTSGDLAVTFSSETVPFTVTQRQAAEAAAAARLMAAGPLVVADGDDAFTVEAETIRAAIGFGATAAEPYGVVFNGVVLGAAVDQWGAAVHRDGVNANFTFNAAGPTGVVPAIPGRELNRDGTVSSIIAGLRDRGAGRAVPTVALASVVVEPALSTEQARAIQPDLVRLSTWTTWYVPSDGNGYGANISIPARDLDGMLLLPGDEFDFWRDIGPVTAERGYTYGGAIIGGRSTGGVALAGGICSTSTTLFNTALRAGLRMGDRLNHYYYIDRYPVGLDATVFATDYWAQTMSFTNDTDSPLIIRSFTSPGMVRFDLWGLPLNREVTFSTPIITNRTYASDVVEYTSSLPAGTSRRVEYPHHGFDVTVTRTVRDTATGEVIHEDVYFSAYQTVNGLTMVGSP